MGLLKIRFLVLFATAKNRDDTVAGYLGLSNGWPQWNPTCIRPLCDWELESRDSFLPEMYSAKVSLLQEDRLIWTPSKSQGFSEYSYCIILSGGDCFFSSPWKEVWWVRVPPSVGFFVWSTEKGKILATDNLRSMVIRNWCLMCESDAEDIDHLFLYCAVTGELWAFNSDTHGN